MNTDRTLAPVPQDLTIATVALYEAVAERLRGRILAHELKPGDWIDEQALALEFGISRTPMREALKVLAAEGLVTLRPRRGCYVTEISDQDLDEIFPILAMLEAQATREAVSRMDAAALEDLQQRHAVLEVAYAAADVDRFFEANQGFHRRILELSGNRWLDTIITDLRKVMMLRRRESLEAEGRMAQSLDEHRSLMQALEQGDAELAASRMQAHLAAGRRAALSNVTV